MADAVDKCLKEAFKLVDQLDLDSVLRAQIKDEMEEVFASQARAGVDRIIAAEQVATNAEIRVKAAKLASTLQEAKNREFVEVTGAFDPNDPQSIIDAGRRFAKVFSPEDGNVGPTDEVSLNSLLRQVKQRMDSKVNSVYRVIGDDRGRLKDSELAPAFDFELRGGDSGISEVKEAVKAFRDATEPELKRLRENGVWVDVVKDWAYQSYDLARIRNDEANFKRRVIEGLDPEQHPDPETTYQALRFRLSSRQFETQGLGSVGAQRKIWFKDPETEHEIFMRYGSGNVTSNVVKAINRIAAEVAVSDRAGPIPDRVFSSGRVDANGNEVRSGSPAITLETKLDDISENTNLPRKMRKEAAFANNRMRIARDLLRYGRMNVEDPRDHTALNLLSTARNGIAFLKLGKTPIAQAIEEPFRAAWQGRHLQGGFFKAYARNFKTFARMLDSEGVTRQMAQQQGFTNNAFTAIQLNRMALDSTGIQSFGGSARSASERASQEAAQGMAFTQRYTGGIALEQGQRGTVGLDIQRGLTEHMKDDWGSLNPTVRKQVLESNGITAKDWDSIREQPLNNFGLFDLEALEKKNFRLYQKFHAALLREADIQINLPDIESRMRVGFGRHPNDISGNAVRLITQFMGYNMGLYRNGVKREFGTSTVGGVGFAAGMVINSAIKVQLYALAGFGVAGLFDWDSPDLWWRATIGAGFTHPFLAAGTEFMFGSGGQVPGPTLETTQRFGTNVIQGGKDLYDLDFESATLEGTQVIEDFTPNWWFIDGATNQLFDIIEQELDPEAFRRSQRRFEQSREGLGARGRGDL